jgi:predicted ArsR family transcriptional regulator
MSDDAVSWGLEAAAALREPVRRRLYGYVTRQPGPVGRDQAAAALGLSRAAVAFHLDRLADVGLLTIEFRRLTGHGGPGAGRPAKLYRGNGRTVSLTLPHREHALLAGLMAAGAEPNGISLEAARERGRQIGQATDGRSREAVESALGVLGFAPARDDRTTRTLNCPFEPNSRQYPPVVCGIGQALVEGVIEGAGADLAVACVEPQEGCCITLVRAEA